MQADKKCVFLPNNTPLGVERTVWPVILFPLKSQELHHLLLAFSSTGSAETSSSQQVKCHCLIKLDSVKGSGDVKCTVCHRNHSEFSFYLSD